MKRNRLDFSAHPNPFNSSTTITYDGLEGAGSLHIYGITGRLVRRLELDQSSGVVTRNATDDGGEAISSGVYLAKITKTSISQTLKLLLIR
jgi:hypothetical protein